MYWDEAEVEKYIRHPTEGHAAELGSPIHSVARDELVRGEPPTGAVDALAERGYDYAPVRPYHSREYYDAEAGAVRSIDEQQYVRYDEMMPYCINVLTEYSFALVTHPDSDSWRIVTAADLNARTAKQYLFTYYAETVRVVSELIQETYGVEEVQRVYEDARSGGEAVERWRTAVDESVDLHPVEFMSIADLKEIVRDNECLLDELGFPSKTRCGDAFDTVEAYRNKVMHGNRSVVADETDVAELVASLELACEIAVEAGGDTPA